MRAARCSYAAEQIAQLGIEDEAVQAVAELLLKEEGAFTRHMAAKDMKARHFAAYAATLSREPGGRARKRKGSRAIRWACTEAEKLNGAHCRRRSKRTWNNGGVRRKAKA